jgi:type II secretory pathway pseudopilin PulG
MGVRTLAGFTIIETMLFLGISSALVVALIAGTGASLNTQRYNDAVQSFKSVLQQQYSELTSVQNSRDNNWSCGSNAVPSTTATTSQIRGQSNCMLVGKYMRLVDDKISIYTVIGYAKQNSSAESNDITSLKNNYVLSLSRVNVDKNTLEWGTQIAYPATDGGAAYFKPANPRKMAILFVRSPDSGQIYTLTSSDDSVPDDEDSIGSGTLAGMLVSGPGIPGQGSRLICVDSGGLLSNANRGIKLRAFAATGSAVETVSNDYLAKNGDPLRC